MDTFSSPSKDTGPPDQIVIFNSVIKKCVEEHDIKCERADERFISEPIVQNVKSKIASAEIVIVDFTGRNPNVYFEAGLAMPGKRSG